MQTHRSLILALAAVATAGCFALKVPAPSTPAAAPLIEGRDVEFTATCTALFVGELDRPAAQPWGPGDDGLEACLDLARSGYTAEQLMAWVRSSAEYTTVQAARARRALEEAERRKREEEERERHRPRLRGRLRADGVKILDATGQAFMPAFASVLTAHVADDAGLRELRRQLRDLGFNGLRHFSGRLAWANQSVERARATLPALLKAAADDGLYVQVTALTDSRDGGYNEREHLAAIAAITAPFENVILEVANELYHGTQSDLVNDVSRLCTMAREVLAGYPNLWGLGAGSEDEPINGRYSADCGPINFVHLRRGRPDDMLDAMYGLAEIARVTRKPVINSEPIGAAEIDRPGSRLSDAGFFGRMGNRCVSLGYGCLFHSEDGLYARPLGPVQLGAAKAFMDGMRSAPVVVPKPQPSDPCAIADEPAEVVLCNRERYPDHMTHEQLADLMKAIVRTLNAKQIAGGPYGVLQKRSGNNCGGYSCDIVCSGNGAAQRQFDVLVDERLATWVPLGEGIRVDVCEIVR